MGRLDQARSIGGEFVNSVQIVCFQRRSELAGVEIRSVENAEDEAFYYSPDYEFFVPITWAGEIWHRRRQIKLEPGGVLIAEPGEAFLCRRAARSGSHVGVSIEAELVAHFAELHGIQLSELSFRANALMSEALSSAFGVLVEALKPGSPSTQLEAALAAWFARAFDELRADPEVGHTVAPAERPAAERVRDCLHEDLSATLDMSRVSRETGLSRFQALRAFKSWYGLPPCAYQLRVRLGLAQRLLRHGARPAAVAAEYGFVDQSHLTRHFRRWLGITPAEYARVGTEARVLRTWPPEPVTGEIRVAEPLLAG